MVILSLATRASVLCRDDHRALVMWILVSSGEGWHIKVVFYLNIKERERVRLCAFVLNA